MSKIAFGCDPVRPETRGVIGIFCRPNHPEGWGICYHDKDEYGRYRSPRAHGYVTIMVVSPDWIHHGRVCAYFLQGDWEGNGAVGVWGRSDRWTGGPYECVFAFEGGIVDSLQAWRWGPGQAVQTTKCPGVYGDNRVFCLYTYEGAMSL